MRVLITAGLAAAAAVTLAACGTGAAPAAAGRPAHPHHVKLASEVRAPAPGSRAEAAALATVMFSRMDLPAGARRLPPTPIPAALQGTPVLGGIASLEVHELFELPQAFGTAANLITVHTPKGMSQDSTGSGGGPSGEFQQVGYSVKSVPAGVYEAQLTLTVAPGASGGSVLRADAQVLWYPPRSAAEYIDPMRYHVLTITVSIYGPRSRTVSKAVTSPAAIARLADVLDASPALPATTISCPIGGAYYQLRFAAAEHEPAVIVVGASQPPCEGISVAVRGRQQPLLENATSLTDAVNRLLGIRPPD